MAKALRLCVFGRADDVWGFEGVILSKDAVLVKERLSEIADFPVDAGLLVDGFRSGAQLMSALRELSNAGYVRVEGNSVWYSEPNEQIRKAETFPLTKVGVFVAALLAAGAASVPILNFLGFSDIGDLLDAKPELQVSEQENSPEPLLVAFTGGEECRVSLSVTYQLPEQNVAAAHKEFGSPEAAAKEIETHTGSSALSILESNDLGFVRNNRRAIEDDIAHEIRSRIYQPGYEIRSVGLQQIDCQ